MPIDSVSRIDHRLRSLSADRRMLLALRLRDALGEDLRSAQGSQAADAADDRLLAYLVAETLSRAPRAATLRAFLSQHLPDYMIPDRFVPLDALPLDDNGKVDLNALPSAGDVAADPRASHTSPATEVERRIAAAWAEVLGVAEVGVLSNFFELGGNSLLAVRVYNRLRELFGGEVTMVDLFQHPTVRSLAGSLEDQIGKSAAGSGAERRGGDGALDLAAEVELDGAIRPQPGTSPGARAPAAVFLTGGSGFLGVFLLSELLRETAADVHCLVRASDVAAGVEKLRRRLEACRVWRPQAAKRIVAVPGDLSQPLLGLSRGEFSELAARVGTIYHCGAWVDFNHPYRSLRRANVQGTQEVLRLAAHGAVKPCHYVSTLSVWPESTPLAAEALPEDGPLPSPDGVRDGYSQSKWVAEGIVRLARSRGLPVTIYRPGTISGHSRSGVCNTQDLLWRAIKGCVQLGAVPETSEELDLAPVDWVSRAIVHLSRRRSSLGTVFHLFNPEPSPLSALFDALATLGYALRRLPYRAWRSELVASVEQGRENALAAFMPLLAPRDEGATANAEASAFAKARFDDRNTRRGLAGSGIRCPPVAGEQLRASIEYLAETGFLQPPSGDDRRAQATISEGGPRS